MPETQAVARRTPLALIGALIACVGAESAVLAGGAHLVGAGGLALVLVAAGAWAVVVTRDDVDAHPGLVVAALAVAFAVALALPPRNSHDLWSYVMYGRTVSVHHTSPYVHAPRTFPADPFLTRVAAGWRAAPSVYGPLFTGVSAALAKLAGASALRARLAFQLLGTLGVVAALALVWRETRSARAIAFAGLHPAIVTAIVNGGHNDALVGLAILAGVLLASRGRWTASGVVLGLGVLVKASAGLGLLGVGAWAVTRDRRAAARLATAALVTAAAGYAPAGWIAVRAVVHAGNGNSRASIWDPVSSALHLPTAVMVGAALLLATAAAWRRRGSSSPRDPTIAVLAASLVGGVYVLPWYPAWALATAALRRRSTLAAVIGVHAAFLVAVYEYELPAHPTLTGAWGGIRTGLLQAAAWSLLACFLLACFGRRSGRRRIPGTEAGSSRISRRTSSGSSARTAAS